MIGALNLALGDVYKRQQIGLANLTSLNVFPPRANGFPLQAAQIAAGLNTDASIRQGLKMQISLAQGIEDAKFADLKKMNSLFGIGENFEAKA